MELIGKQIAIETILGQPPELHYPSWYAAQIEKLPPAPPEYLAEQAGILVTDSDTISRQAAIDAIYGITAYKGTIPLGSAIFNINKIPAAQPEPKRGKWESQSGGGYCCSECGRYAMDKADGRIVMISVKSKFCPNCGAKMEVTE